MSKTNRQPLNTMPISTSLSALGLRFDLKTKTYHWL